MIFRALAAVVAAAGLWAFWLEPASLSVREYRIELPGWPETLSGLRVAVLSDLHVGSPFNGLDRLREVVERTNAEQPDLTLLAGDYVIQGVLGGSFVEPAEIAPELAKLEARLGVFAVMGNHDWWLEDPQRVLDAFDAHDIPLLDNRSVEIPSAEPFWLAGVGDWWEGHPNVAAALADVPAEAPRLLFTHNPDVFPMILERVDLTIAGHTHGGQVYLPLLGRLIVPSDYGERYAQGLIEEEGKRMFVSTGVGTSILPVRFLTPPEISVLEIVRAR